MNATGIFRVLRQVASDAEQLKVAAIVAAAFSEARAVVYVESSSESGSACSAATTLQFDEVLDIGFGVATA